MYSLDFNIEESIINCKCLFSKGLVGNIKGCFGISYKNYIVWNLEFYKIYISVRVLCVNDYVLFEYSLFGWW